MSVIIKKIESEKDIRLFVDIQFKLYKNSKFWVPPLKKDEIKSIKRETNPSLKDVDFELWIAYKDNEPVGRIGAMIHHKSNQFRNENVARFTRFEFINDIEVSKALIHTAEAWAKAKGADAILGPLGFSNLDHQGMQVEGFEFLPSYASEYHHSYYLEHLTKLGYEKKTDWIEFRVTIPDQIPEKAIKVADSVKERFGMKVLAFNNTKDLIPYGKSLFLLINEAFSELFSFVPFSESSIDYYVNKYLPLLKAKFVKLIIDKDENLVGFIVPMPSLSLAMQKAKGKLFPFGWYHLLNAYKNNDTIDLLLTGIDPKLQGMGYSALLMVETQKTAQENGAKYAETTGIFETNSKAIQHWKNYEHVQHKRKRCFIKQLTNNVL
ncbi:MAG: hypothetical protein IPO21_14140 [Bacteroidales bacterium]|nr:hypothetical protein [Bacteroidales bacterium]